MKALHLVIVVLFLLCYCEASCTNDLGIDELVKEADELASVKRDSSLLKVYKQIIRKTAGTNRDTAIHYIKLSLDLSEEIGDEVTAQKAAHNLSLLYYRRQDFKKSIDYGNVLLSKSSEGFFYVRALMFIGQANRELSNFEEAYDFINRARVEAEQIKDTILFSSATLDLGEYYQLKGENSNAIKYYLEGIEGYKSVGDKKGQEVGLQNLVTLFDSLGDSVNALKYNEMAEQLIAPDDISGIAFNLKGKGNIYMGVKEYDKAIKCMKESIELAKKIPNEGLIYGNYYNLALICLQTDKIEQAASYLAEAKKYASSHRQIRDLLYIEAGINLENRDCPKLKKTLKAIKKMLNPTVNFHYLHSYYYYRAGLEACGGDPLMTVKFIDSLNLYKDSTYYHNQISEVKDLEAKYNKALDQQHIAEKDLLIQKEQSNSQKKTLGLFGLGLFIPFLIGGITWNRKKRNEIQLLNRELSHRVKNNLEFISSLLHLQSRELEDAGTKEALLDSENRIHALSAVYKKLYGDDGVVPINLQEYLIELTENLKDTFDHKTNDLDIQLKAHELLIEPEKATKIGLIINELVTNSIKYAFKEEANPIISVEFKKENGQLHLKFSDNGSGITTGDNAPKKSFGIGLIEKLVKQLNGKMDAKNENGLSYDFSFKGL